MVFQLSLEKSRKKSMLS